MKLNFALNLTDDRIALLHRTEAGWAELGAARFGADDMDERLAEALAAGTALAPRGLTTKIVVPNAQILYTEMEIAPGPVAARRDDIREALTGRTPYAVDDLVFDFVGEDRHVQVAVVAQETLDQAEDFAVRYGFRPMAFVSIPPEGAFAGEPFFGLTKIAPTLPGKGRKVERDATPIALLAPAVASEVTPDHNDAVQAFPETAEFAAADSWDAPATREPIADIPAETPVQPDATVAAEPVAAAPAAAPAPEPEPLSPAETRIAPQPEPAPDPVAELLPERRRFGSVVDPQVQDVDEAPFADVTVAEATPTLDDDLPPAPSTAALMAFASRRAATAGNTTMPPRAMPEPTMPGSVAERVAAPAPSQMRPEPRVTVSGAVSVPPNGKKLRKPDQGSRAAAPVIAASVASADAPRKPLTKPGGTFGSAAPARGKPRFLGLILTGILVLFLALLAAWSSFFLASGSDPALTPDSEVALTDAPAIEDEALADGQDPAALTADDPLADVVAAPEAIVEPGGPEPAPDPAPDALAATPEPETAGPAPETGVVTTGPAPVQPAAESDEIVLSRADTPLTQQQAANLAAPDLSADAVPVPQMPPPPFGTEYTFNENGTIRAVPEGIMTPDGVRLVAGRPANVPPARPAATTAPATTAPDPVAAPEVDETTAVGADPALADARPRARPAGLVPPGTDDDAALATDGPVMASSPRPLARPAAVVAANAAPLPDPARASDAASLAAASAAAGTAAEAIIQDLAAAEPATTPSGSRLAVSVSRIPAPRPRDLERAVAAALEAATRAPAPEPEPEPQQAAAAAPEAEPEPEVEAAVVAAPTSGSVADRATFVNALNLSRINLIGVYGTQSNRYALIRQANGRYKRVEVGDRIDGGVVQAITANEVRYQKGGRLIALQMPQG